jgi:hypothetical protein
VLEYLQLASFNETLDAQGPLYIPASQSLSERAPPSPPLTYSAAIRKCEALLCLLRDPQLGDYQSLVTRRRVLADSGWTRTNLATPYDKLYNLVGAFNLLGIQNYYNGAAVDWKNDKRSKNGDVVVPVCLCRLY